MDGRQPAGAGAADTKAEGEKAAGPAGAGAVGAEDAGAAGAASAADAGGYDLDAVLADASGENLTRLSHDYWTGRAQEYSELHEREMATPRGDAFVKLLSGMTGIRSGARVLDLGCGSGFMTICLAKNGCRVTSVDFSAEMLDQARANVAAHGLDAAAIDFLQMDVHDLAFADGTFDAVVSRNVTWVLEDVPRVYAEVARVLRSGGTFLNMDAGFGAAAIARVASGRIPTHPTQTPAQLTARDHIVVNLPISQVERPQWDLDELWGLGFSYVGAHRSLDSLLAAAENGGVDLEAVHAEPHTQEGLFLIIATK